MSYSRIKEHLDSQDKGIARKSSVPKVHPLVTHPGMASQTRGTLGGPTQGNPSDASSPLPTDPSRQGKAFAIPKVTHSMTSDSERGSYDPASAEKVMGECKRSPDDFARDLHTLPTITTEE